MSAEKENEDQGIERLIECLKKYEKQIDMLEKEIAFHCRRNQLTRGALVQAREAIKSLQAAGSHHKANARRKPALILPAPKPHRSGFFEFEWPVKKGRSIYISRIRLEKVILHQARIKVRGIEGVVVDFVSGKEASGGPNWRVCGIASGKADTADALKAVQDAARSCESCEMVADGSPLDGRPVKTRPRPTFGNPPRPDKGSPVIPTP